MKEVSKASIPSMTPEELLAPENYAVVRYDNDSFSYICGAFNRRGKAMECASELCGFYENDYRVVRIQHAGEVAVNG